jgi:hypothetical protein
MLAAVAMTACVSTASKIRDEVKDGNAIILGPVIEDGMMRRAPVSIRGENYIASADVWGCAARMTVVYIDSPVATFFHGTSVRVRDLKSGNNVFDHLCNIR